MMATTSNQSSSTSNNSNSVSNGRNIWKTKRDKERMYARHEILERMLLVDESDTSSLSPLSLAASSTSHSYNSIIRSFFHSIEKRDISAFGIAKLVKKLTKPNLLDGLYPVSHLNLQQAYYMCASRFGLDFGKCALNYLEYENSANNFSIPGGGISLIAYAAMLGEFQIVSSLLKGGADPTAVAAILCDDTAITTTSKTTRSLSLQQHFRRLFFLEHFPPMFAVWIVRCVVVMRIHGVSLMIPSLQEVSNNYETVVHENKRKNESCPICKDESSLHLLNWGAPCYHSFCESCCWEDILHHMDERNEILCPICLSMRMDKPKPAFESTNNSLATDHEFCQLYHPQESSLSSLAITITPMERLYASLDKFNALPHTKDHITTLSGNTDETASNSSSSNSADNHVNIKISKRKNTVDTSWTSSLVRYMGRSQDVRRDAFFYYVARNANQYVKGLLQAGVHVNDVNEYHQTNLYIASWHGFTSIVKLLLHYGADPNIQPNGSIVCYSSSLSVAKTHNHKDIVKMLLDAAAVEAPPSSSSISDQHQRRQDDESVPKLVSLMQSTVLENNNDDSNANRVECASSDGSAADTILLQSPKLTILIPTTTKNHPGAGSFIIDHVVSERTLQHIEVLWKACPVEYGRKGKENSTTCATRSYFCDAESILTKQIENQVNSHLLLPSIQESVVVMPHMRFLHYANENISLPPHVDLARVDRFGRRSTHSFLLYLFDCEQGGETILRRRHQSVTASSSNKEQEDEEVVIVRPERGRLLVFPHLCPHEGGAVISVPKVLIRGEIYLSGTRSINSTTHF